MTQIVCAIKLRRRLATLLNVAHDSQNILSTWSHTLHKAVQTYDVEMTCQRSIYSVSVTNNHARARSSGIAYCNVAKINIITRCTIGF